MAWIDAGCTGLVLRPGAAHGSLPRQFGAGAMAVVMDHIIPPVSYSRRRAAWSAAPGFSPA
jgi:hypothetical protein